LDFVMFETYLSVYEQNISFKIIFLQGGFVNKFLDFSM